MLFSRETLGTAARRGGFGRVEVTTTSVNAWSFAFGSGLSTDGPVRRALRATLFQADAALLRGSFPGSGEELVLRAWAL
jgi:hypothetical protein